MLIGKNMKVTFVLDSFGGGGKERRCLQLIQGLIKIGYKDIQVIIINNEIAYEELYTANINLLVIDRRTRGLSILQTLRELSSAIKSFGPDVLQVWGIYSAFFINILRVFIPFKFIAAYVADCNTPQFFSVNNLIVRINQFLVDKTVGNSQAGLDAYRISKKKAQLIYNGFNLDRLKKVGDDTNTIRTSLNISTKFVIPMFARFDPSKDFKTFITAAKDITQMRDDVTFLCVGNKSDSQECKNLVDVGTNDRIRFLGFRSDVESILSISTLSVLCSNPAKHKEGISNSILESLVFNVPVIASDDGGTPEIIEHGVNGWLIPPSNAQVLSTQINSILNSIDDCKVFSNNLQKQVIEKFSLEKMINAFDELYKSV